jgi:hypothetical protein
MFMRSFFAVAGMLIVAGTLAVASAMATDEPAPPGQGTPAPPAQGTPAPPARGIPVPPAQGSPLPRAIGKPRACVDHVRPLSRLSVSWRRGFRHGVIRGIAIDQGCGAAGAGKVKRVSVAIARKVGKRCQPLKRNGRLGRAIACKPVWLSAKGSKQWIFRLRHQLPRGKYIVNTRAVDSAGNIQA